jgi:hypothetical protein
MASTSVHTITAIKIKEKPILNDSKHAPVNDSAEELITPETLEEIR